MIIWNAIGLMCISCLVASCEPALHKPVDPLTLLRYEKRAEEQQQQQQSSGDDKNPPVEFDEYPVVVPKRTALLLDRLMVALQKAVDGNASGNMKGYYPERTIPIISGGATRPNPGMELQRRNQQKGRLYWRCYFNAVSCFKKKK
ncbi:uncharacterized protein LOC126841882 [Adelges cooleyi]|uniref:uncharacterized protein LOC126841882 n=1 Tax=Adelges cooleyi TaxID=133065 RepID=UPI00217F82E9|nr:uncharacterized protein LOC126841882 [Adelges cooleyi]XP_050434589.1 uncharacterized protein LOC126841882 [Adelges cooleyi]